MMVTSAKLLGTPFVHVEGKSHAPPCVEHAVANDVMSVYVYVLLSGAGVTIPVGVRVI